MSITTRLKYSLSFVCLFHFAASAATPQAADLQHWVDQPIRSAEDKARDPYRHPVETLSFFGLKPDMQVLEIWPARGWYTEILAPYLKDKGKLTVATFRSDDGSMTDDRKIFWSRITEKLNQHLTQNASYFGPVQQLEFDPPAYMYMGPVNQYDMVLSFRNSHIWNEQGYLLDVFRAVYDVLKPGGVFGLVDHRASKVSEISSSAVEGYLDESYVIHVAGLAGLQLVAQSEINANPNDTKDYPKGVYALPPTLAMGLADRSKYLAIGESDRMTLKFVKPTLQ